jgi:hypothetical protein
MVFVVGSSTRFSASIKKQLSNRIFGSWHFLAQCHLPIHLYTVSFKKGEAVSQDDKLGTLQTSSGR